MITLTGLTSNSIAQDSDSVFLPKIEPPEIVRGRHEIRLPDTVDDLDVDGGGRFIAMHFKDLGKIGVFDVNELKIVGYISSDGQFCK